MSKIRKLREKHEKEIDEVQKNCPHKKSDWLDRLWGSTINGRVRVCNECGKELKFESYMEVLNERKYEAYRKAILDIANDMDIKLKFKEIEK